MSKKVIILGGGIGGLTFALELEKRGIPFTVYEAAPEYRPLGVGLNLLPHAVKSLAALGLLDDLMSKGVETREYQFYTRNGQLVHTDPRGRAAGYDIPQCSIHRGDLHQVLIDAVIDRAGPDAIVMNHKGLSVAQTKDEAIVHFVDGTTDEALPDVKGDVVVACDGVNSIVRKQFHPEEAVPRYEGTMNYRGTTKWKPFLTGATMIYMGTTETGKLILYPIRENIDGEGTQLINWVIEIQRPNAHLLRDWNKTSDINDFIEDFGMCNFDFLNIPELMRQAEHVFEYPMCDQETLPWWTKGRITLLGDAAHPMMPRGSNGAAQAIIDGEVLAELLKNDADWSQVLIEYENTRRETVGNIVHANRGIAPDAILRVVEERTGGKRFDDINEVIPQAERDEWQARYKKTAGFAPDQLRNT